jgi:alkanesulfonate monooxygenase SsuD/methylene tetrahydromethanopterin reductase-like flavin-dependent oxidoreductase (luciferase family)
VRYAIDISPAGRWGAPRALAEMAALAEQAGWDGVFLEDYVMHPSGLDTYDPWIALGAVALATERVRVGTLVTPLSRRRPWKVAAEALTVDHMSGGRLVLGVGSGDPQSADIGRVGEASEPRERASLLDEALEVIVALWSGEPVTHHGPHFDLFEARLRPRPVQQPRIPIWVGGQLTRLRPRTRALHWDGACLYRVEPPDWQDVSADDVRKLRSDAADTRQDEGTGFDICVGGRERGEDESAERAYLAEIEEAGATWWHEYLPPSTPVEAARERIGRGPLRPG